MAKLVGVPCGVGKSSSVATIFFIVRMALQMVEALFFRKVHL